MRNKIALLLFAAAALLVAGLLSGIGQGKLFRVDLRAGNGQLTGTAPLPGTVSSSLGGQALLINPHYTGQDDQGRRWEIIADRADQLPNGALASTTLKADAQVPGELQNANLITAADIKLITVNARYFAAVGHGAAVPVTSPTLTLNAREGIYRQNDKTLHLKDDVVIVGNGFTMKTPAVTAQVVSRTAQGNQGVVITGPLGSFDSTLTGDTFTVDQNAGHVTVLGNVKARLQPQ